MVVNLNGIEDLNLLITHPLVPKSSNSQLMLNKTLVTNYFSWNKYSITPFRYTIVILINILCSILFTQALSLLNKEKDIL